MDAQARQKNELREIERESERFRERRETGKDITETELEEERRRRKLMGVLGGRKFGGYEGDPVWDDVVPIEQDDGEGALAQIAYTGEYAEAMGYLRAIMAANELSPRVLGLTSHIITLNPAHYTVWLYRARTLFAIDADVHEELEWVNEIALENQKNYQIWHHRQLLIDHLFSSLDPAQIQELATKERTFMTEMFDADAKNYHVWSYRQYLVRKMGLWDVQQEMESVEALLRRDVRNNSAWSHRFFLVFSNPGYATEGCAATRHDPKIPDPIIERELQFAKAATFEAPQNQSPWNYIRGVLRKAGRELRTLEGFAGEFVVEGEGVGEEVRSSHALEFLVDVWGEKGEVERVTWGLGLLAGKYDRIRRGYWEWRGGELGLGGIGMGGLKV
ncbi:hypothetical protein HYFRA_00002840 [Hymenoscyphus fraxineus]|uniref:Protein farnesyltransferase/geranylgeranyltransferase type-1 subunit alpha n=1 Tax=Hymenoscyphus fraxineus TaxID=746836 RepID=A0A9N9PL26_9HELO|nr:hypothetical protein HYFRA_00002840 [Hymenoscyphus fraxineus]